MRNKVYLVDINKKQYQTAWYKQYDNDIPYTIRLVDDGVDVNLSGYNISAFFKNKVGNVFEKSCTIQEESLIKTTLDNNILGVDGDVNVEFVLERNSQIVTTFTITIRVEKSINRNEALTEQPQWDIIKDLFNLEEILNNKMDEINEFISEKVTEIQNSINEANTKIDEALNKIPTGGDGTFNPNTEFQELETTDKTVIGAINELFKEIKKINNADYASKIKDVRNIEPFNGWEVTNNKICKLTKFDLGFTIFEFQIKATQDIPNNTVSFLLPFEFGPSMIMPIAFPAGNSIRTGFIYKDRQIKFNGTYPKGTVITCSCLIIN
ncbi:MAG: hypothetical protein KIB00_16275 [Paeniclostridium sordellii]|nr:hypothetical protein [Paeniclostridium sordellii]